MREISRMLRPNGVLLITIPYGKSSYARNTLFRIYNNDSLKKLIQRLSIESARYYANYGGYWIPVSKERAEKL